MSFFNPTVARLFLLALATTATALALAGPASAAGTATVSGNELSFVGGAGESNALTVSYDSVLLRYVLTESSTALNAGSGCNQVTSSSVYCPGVFVDTVSVDTGTGSDDITSGSNFGEIVTSVLMNADQTANLSPGLAYISTDGLSIGGGPGSDIISSTGDDVMISGGAGNDIISLKPTNTGSEFTDFPPNTVAGGDGNDVVDATEATIGVYYASSFGDDKFYGGSGNDLIAGGHGHDFLVGGPGDDEFNDLGDPDGGDDFWGGVGNDYFEDDSATVNDSHFDGGPGVDSITYNATSPIHISIDFRTDANGVAGESDHIHPTIERIGLQGPRNGTFSGMLKGNDVLEGSPVNNFIKGWAGDDTIRGLAGADNLQGYDGNDIVDGGVGNDSVSGNNGDDTLTGGAGSDSINGGGGGDTINADDGVADTITCGGGTDSVDADALDVFTDPTNCESVT